MYDRSFPDVHGEQRAAAVPARARRFHHLTLLVDDTAVSRTLSPLGRRLAHVALARCVGAGADLVSLHVVSSGGLVGVQYYAMGSIRVVRESLHVGASSGMVARASRLYAAMSEEEPDGAVIVVPDVNGLVLAESIRTEFHVPILPLAVPGFAGRQLIRWQFPVVYIPKRFMVRRVR